MQFKLKNTTYKISFSFLALILYALTIRKAASLDIILLFSILHELVHLVFVYIFSVAPEIVSFNIMGANIKRGVISTLNINSEILINASAPVFNILTGAVFYLLSKYSFHYRNQFSETAYINFILGFFNLLPFYSFDGGNVLKYLLLKLFDKKRCEQILTIVSLLITLIFSFISIHIFINYKHNFSLLLICAYMFISIIFKKQNSLDI